MRSMSGRKQRNDALTLNNVVFYLTDVASLWYRSRPGLPSNALFNILGRYTTRKLHAEQRLQWKVKLQCEYFTSYIEDIINLGTEQSSSTSEADRIEQVLKRIDADKFHILIARSSTTVADICALCHNYDELCSQRLRVQSPSDQRNSLSSLAVSGTNSSLLGQVEAFVRQEAA